MPSGLFPRVGDNDPLSFPNPDLDLELKPKP